MNVNDHDSRTATKTGQLNNTGRRNNLSVASWAIGAIVLLTMLAHQFGR